MQKKKKEMDVKYEMAMWAFAAIAVGCVICLFAHYFKLHESAQVYEKFREIKVSEKPVEDVKEEPKKEKEKEEQLVYCERLYDIDKLREQNEDIYAWITVPQTQVDYPILQSETDNYYLDTNIDGTKGYPGSIYTNKCNQKDFTDGNTVVYGHNMKDGSMFQGLHQFADSEFFDNNNKIIVYTQDVRLPYQIYAAVKFSDAYIPAEYDFSTPEGTEKFLAAIEENKEEVSHIREGLEVKPEDRIITLSTCVAGENDKRYLVVGKLLEEAYYK